jgi:hypothetical protein
MIAWILAVSIVALGSIVIKPKRALQVWLLPALVLLGIAMISVLIVYLILSPYEAGKVMGTFYLPIIISYFALTYLLRAKYHNGQIKRFQLVIVFAALILFSAPSIIVSYLQKSANFSVKSILSSREKEAIPNLVDYHNELMSNNDEIWALNYHNLSFGHEGFWKVTTETLEEDWAYQVMCESRTDSTEFILIMWIEDSVAPSELVSGFVKDLEANFYTLGPISNGSTIDEEKVSFSFSKNNFTFGVETNSPTLGENVGEIEAFIKGPRTVLIMKQTTSSDRLSTLFKTIEDSMDFID